MARWVGVGTQQPHAGVEPATSRSQSPASYHSATVYHVLCCCYLSIILVRSDRSETESEEGLVIHSSRPSSCINSQVWLCIRSQVWLCINSQVWLASAARYDCVSTARYDWASTARYDWVSTARYDCVSTARYDCVSTARYDWAGDNC